MTASALPLVFTLLSAVPVTSSRLAPDPDAPTAKEQRVRHLWLPPDGEAVEVFAGLFGAEQWPNTLPVSFPVRIKHIEADADAVVLIRSDDEEEHLLWIAARRPLATGPGSEVRVTLEDDSTVTLHVLTRPDLKDARITLRPRPYIDPEETARFIGERLLKCQPEEERISGKARLIAQKGSLAVINRAEGDGSSNKQVNGFQLSFVDVVHDEKMSYATLLLMNDSENNWTVDLKQIHLVSADTKEVRIISRASQQDIIPPQKDSRVVLAYPTPDSPEKLVAIIEDLKLLVGVTP